MSNKGEKLYDTFHAEKSNCISSRHIANALNKSLEFDSGKASYSNSEVFWFLKEYISPDNRIEGTYLYSQSNGNKCRQNVIIVRKELALLTCQNLDFIDAVRLKKEIESCPFNEKKYENIICAPTISALPTSAIIADDELWKNEIICSFDIAKIMSVPHQDVATLLKRYVDHSILHFVRFIDNKKCNRKPILLQKGEALFALSQVYDYMSNRVKADSLQIELEVRVKYSKFDKSLYVLTDHDLAYIAKAPNSADTVDGTVISHEIFVKKFNKASRLMRNQHLDFLHQFYPEKLKFSPYAQALALYPDYDQVDLSGESTLSKLIKSRLHEWNGQKNATNQHFDDKIGDLELKNEILTDELERRDATISELSAKISILNAELEVFKTRFGSNVTKPSVFESIKGFGKLLFSQKEKPIAEEVKESAILYLTPTEIAIIVNRNNKDDNLISSAQTVNEYFEKIGLQRLTSVRMGRWELTQDGEKYGQYYTGENEGHRYEAIKWNWQAIHLKYFERELEDTQRSYAL